MVEIKVLLKYDFGGHLVINALAQHHLWIERHLDFFVYWMQIADCLVLTFDQQILQSASVDLLCDLHFGSNRAPIFVD